MSARLVNVDRRTAMLLPQDMREWVREDDMVHFVLEAVEGMDTRSLRVNERGTGSEQYPPAMMLSLLVYCYANGIFGSRRIERATYRDVAVRYLTGDTHPDHDTIAKFRRENFDAVSEAFVGVLALAREIGVLKVGTVSCDGTKMRSNANKHQSLRYDRAGELVDQLELEVASLLAKAEEADNSDLDEGQSLPKEVARREKLCAKLKEARQRLEQRARRRAEAEEQEYLKKVQAREKRSGKSKGKKIKPPKDTPDDHEQINLTDPDSNLMRKNKRSSYQQCYNAQAVVDADGSQLVLAARVSQSASDSNELSANIERIPEQAGKPTAVVADNGYACEDEAKKVSGDGIEVYVSTGAESHHQRREHDFRPKKDRQPQRIKSQWLKEMRAKLETDEGKALYALRKQTVEPVFGIIKQAMGFRQFLLRGKEKVSGEWQLVVLAYNFKRLWNLKLAMA